MAGEEVGARLPGQGCGGPGRAGDRLRSHEEPQAGLALDPPSPASAFTSPGALGVGGANPGPLRALFERH